MNQTKGTLYSEALFNSTEEQIITALKYQGVVKVEQMKRRNQENL